MGDDTWGWKVVWEAAHEIDKEQDDGTTKKVKVDEGQVIAAACVEGRGAACIGQSGLWIGKWKYTITNSQKMDVGSAERLVIAAAATKPEVGGTVVMGIYDEEKGQVKGNCMKAVLD